MIFNVFGKTSDVHSKFVSLETVKKIKESFNADICEVAFYDIDKPLGQEKAGAELIYYVPTVICEEDGHELGYLENKFAIGHNDVTGDINMCQEWWKQLKDFVADMIDAEKNREAQ